MRYDNSHRGNSFDDAGLNELVGALEELATEPLCSVIRLEMAGENFCGGWDTRSFGSLSRASVESVAAALAGTDAALDRIRRLPVPVVTAVHGKVIGFGAGLLDAIHVAVAADTATLHLPEVRFGFAPAGVGHALAQGLPRKAAYPMLLGVSTASAQDLLGWGLVSAVTAPESAEELAGRWTDRLADLPGDVSRAVLSVVDASLRTGTPDEGYTISAGTIVSMLPGPESAS